MLGLRRFRRSDFYVHSSGKLEQIRAQVQSHLDGRQSTELTAARKAELESTIRGHLKAHNAVIVAHYYTAPEIQALAEATGGCVSDSLEMARFGRDHPAETLIVAGVRFMGETAKILTPGKRVLMPTLEATCSSMRAVRSMSFPPSVTRTPTARWWSTPTLQQRSKPGRIGW